MEHKTKIFATARGYGEFKGGWEFPGGKIEPGETPQQAVVREIKEELDATVKVGNLITTIEYDYPNLPSFHGLLLVRNRVMVEISSSKQKLQGGLEKMSLIRWSGCRQMCGWWRRFGKEWKNILMINKFKSIDEVKYFVML